MSGPIPGRDREEDVFSRRIFQIGTVTHSASYPIDTAGLFTRGKAAGV